MFDIKHTIQINLTFKVYFKPIRMMHLGHRFHISFSFVTQLLSNGPDTNKILHMLVQV